MSLGIAGIFWKWNKKSNSIVRQQNRLELFFNKQKNKFDDRLAAGHFVFQQKYKE